MRVTVFAILFYVLTVSSASAGIAGNVWLDSCEKGESKKHKAWEYYLGLCRGNIEGAGGMFSSSVDNVSDLLNEISKIDS